MSTVGSAHAVMDNLTEMQQMIGPLADHRGAGANAVQRVLHKQQAWSLSCQRFCEHVRKEFPLYWDMLAPFAAGVVQVSRVNVYFALRCSKGSFQSWIHTVCPINRSLLLLLCDALLSILLRRRCTEWRQSHAPCGHPCVSGCSCPDAPHGTPAR